MARGERARRAAAARRSAPSDLAPHYDRVEARLGVRERNDWPKSVRTVEPAFRALGSELESVRSYTDAQLHALRLVPPGLPDERRQVDAQHLHPRRLGGGQLELRAGAHVERVVIEDGEATGVEYIERRRNASQRVDAGAVVVAGGTLNTPQLLLRSGLPDSPSSRLIGRNLGFHPARLVYGLFDEPQDAHMVYPITAHAMGHQHDEDGGFVIEATTIQDPIGFATTLEDENGPLWGAAARRGAARASATGSACSRWSTTRTTAASSVDENGAESFSGVVQRARARAHRRRARLLAQGARSRPAPRASAGPGCITTHVQGTCRMGSDPERSVVDADAQSWDVKRLYVGDGSLVPHTLSVNPSLTIMALATASPRTSTPTRTGTSRERAGPRPRAPLAHRAAHAEAGGEPLLLPRDPRHGGLGRERGLGLPARASATTSARRSS